MKRLKQKYIITKTDGTPVDPSAKYFVLRYDAKVKDKKFLVAVRRALCKLALELIKVNIVLSKELYDDVTNEIIKSQNL